MGPQTSDASLADDRSVSREDPPYAPGDGGDTDTARSDTGAEAEPAWSELLGECGIREEEVVSLLEEGENVQRIAGLLKPAFDDPAVAYQAALDIVAMAQEQRLAAELVDRRECELSLGGRPRKWQLTWYSGQPHQEGRPAVFLPRRTGSDAGLLGRVAHGFVTHHMLSEAGASKLRRRLKVAGYRKQLLAAAALCVAAGGWGLLSGLFREEGVRMLIAGGVLGLGGVFAAFAWLVLQAVPKSIMRIGAGAFHPWWLVPHLEGRALAEQEAAADERMRQLTELVHEGKFRKLKRELGSTSEAVAWAAQINEALWSERTLAVRSRRCGLCGEAEPTHWAASVWRGRMDGSRRSTDWPLLLFPPYWFFAAWRSIRSSISGAGDPEGVEFESHHPLCERCRRSWLRRRRMVSLAVATCVLGIGGSVSLMAWAFIDLLTNPLDGSGGWFFLAGLGVGVAICIVMSRLGPLRHPAEVRRLAMRPFQMTALRFGPLPERPWEQGVD